MKIFVIRNFETRTYSTHTMFYATSLKQAKILASKFYDKIAPIHFQEEILSELNSKHRNEFYDYSKKRREAIDIESEEIWLEMGALVDTIDVDSESKKTITDLDKYMLLNEKRNELKSERSRLQRNPENLKEYDDFESNNYEMLYELHAYCILETKRKTLNYWFKNYFSEIETDILSMESYTDGD